MIERMEYLNWIIAWREKMLIKVVTGVGRCGLFEVHRGYNEHIIFQCNSASNSKTIWDIKVYRTCGSNNIERFWVEVR